MQMKLQNLIDKLNELADWMESDGYDPSQVDVLVATQPTYPLTGHISNIVSGDSILEYRDDPSGEEREALQGTLWIAVGDGPGEVKFSPYGPKQAWEAQ